MSCSSSTINWYLRPRRNMNCQGISLVMTSERAKSWVATICYLSWSSSVFFRLGNPPVHNKFRKGLGGCRRGPENGFTLYCPKGGQWGKSGSQSQKARSDPRDIHQTRANVKSKRVYQTKVDLQPDIAIQSPPPLIYVSPQTSIHNKTPNLPKSKGGRFIPQHNWWSIEVFPRGMEQAIAGQVHSADNTGFNPTLSYSCAKTLPTSSDEQGNELNFEWET